MARRITRREFIETTTLTAAGLAAASADAGGAAAPLPTRPFGRTGLQVTCLAFGCGSRFLMYEQEAVAVEVLNGAVDQGIRYLDTAVGYGDGESERRVGLLMRTRRKDVILATKIPRSARTRDAALRQVEASLKRLQTDHVDVLHLHDLTDAQDLAAIEAPNGALKALYELRSQKVTRAIGMTSHTDGAVMAKAIEQNDLDCVQMAMNPARALQFEELALPAAKKKGLGVILMKVTSQEKLVGAGPGKADMSSLLRYALSLPVSTVVVGMPKREFIAENIAIARGFSPMTEQEIDRVRKSLAPQQAAVASFFSGHVDA
jgi:aryl-alcohol dehydrogenase-like predicted oxidoreductase